MFPVCRSAVDEDTSATFVTTPVDAGRTTTVIAAASPPANEPRSPTHSLPFVVQTPRLASVETNVAPAGQRLVRNTFSTVAWPALETASAYVRLLPTATGSGESTSVSAMSATCERSYNCTLSKAQPSVSIGKSSYCWNLNRTGPASDNPRAAAKATTSTDTLENTPAPGLRNPASRCQFVPSTLKAMPSAFVEPANCTGIVWDSSP